MEAQKAIDADLVNLERRTLPLPQEIWELKTQRNTDAPVSQLPDEILLEIFMVMMTWFLIEDWHQVAHVCRRWRNVAVGASMLWTNPPTHQHNLTILMLERSKGASLTIYMDDNTSTQTAQAIFNCIGRIESLELGDEDDEDEVPNENFFQRISLLKWAQEPSRLKSLKITCYAEESWNGQAMLQLLRPLNQLNELLLTNVVFDWNILPLNNLRHLYFQDVSLPAPISVPQFIEILRQMPHLESLTLPFSGDVLSLHTLPTTSGARFALPSLRLLGLTDSNPDCLVYFLAHTAFPRLRRVDIEIGDPRGYTNFINNYYSAIIHAFASLVKNGDFCKFDQAAFGSSSFRLSMFGGRNDTPVIGLGMPWDQEGESDIGAQIMLDMSELCRPNFSKLSHLNIGGVPTEAEYMQLFARPYHSHLRKITIANLNIMPILTSIFAIPSHDPSESPTIPFPNIKSICCYSICFTNSSVLDAFINCLMLRRECGDPLHELALHYCSDVTSAQLTRLQEAVVNLNLTPTQFFID